MEKYKVKGELLFLYTKNAKDNFQIMRREYVEEWELFFSEKHVYDLFDGEYFLKMVEEGCIIDYDGSLANIFVDGYNSNLGLFCGDFSQGGFLVDAETFREICKEYDVKVNWANK